VAIDAANLNSFLILGESLRELEVTIGPKARPVIAEIRQRLGEAEGRRRDGDAAGAMASIRAAMERMAALAGELDSGEAMLMRMLTDQFSRALLTGDKTTAKGAVKVMRHKAGDPKNDPNSDW
jgi:hypothetical protein